MRTRPRTPRVELLEDRRLLAVLTVNSAADADPPGNVLTLREAIEVVNGTVAISSLSTQQQAQIVGPLSSRNTIDFDIPGTGVQTIKPTTQLPNILTPVIINGYSQPGSSQNTATLGDNAKILIQLDGELAGGCNGINLSGGNSVVEGLDINRFGIPYTSTTGAGGTALDFNNSPGNNLAWGNFIGLDPTGMIAEPSSAYGVSFNYESGPGDTLGGTQPGARNVIEVGSVDGGNGAKEAGVITLHVNNLFILGNYIGTNATGLGVPTGETTANFQGLDMGNHNADSHIGGTQPGAGNVITSVYIGTDPGLLDNGYNVFQGNLIGTNANDTATIAGGGWAGFYVIDSVSNVIGGTAPGAGNVIASPGESAVYLGTDNPGAIEGTVVEGNSIGTNPSGTLNFGDYDGVTVLSSGNVVGDIVPGAGNVIANNSGYGVEYRAAGTTGNRFLDNTMYNSIGGGIDESQSQTLTTPAITAAYPVATGLLIQGGSFTGGTPNTAYVVEFFSNPGFDGDGQAEGRTVLGHIAVITDANGNGSFRTLLPVGVGPGRVVTATVTGPGGNTTPFSPGVIVSAQPGDSMTLSPSATSSKFGQSVWFTAQVIPAVAGIGAPTGSIVFLDGSAVLGSVTLDGNGAATFTSAGWSRGAHRITAVYAGDGVYTGVVSRTITFTVS